MAEVRTYRVFDNQTYIGELLAPARFLDGRSQKTIRLEDGREIIVNASDLKVRGDGSFQLVNAAAVLPAAPVPSAPVPSAPTPPAAMDLPPAAAVPQSLSPLAAMSAPGGEFFQHDYQIERVAVGKIVDVAPEQRTEGNTLILPVIEEILVCEKKIFVKEEVRISLRRQTVDEVRRIQQTPESGFRPNGVPLAGDPAPK